jgi:hypothetical protein
MSPKEIDEDFMDTLENESPSYSNVKIWSCEIKRGRKRIGDNERPYRQKEAKTMKLPKLCTIWLCATEGETCEALLGKWV